MKLPILYSRTSTGAVQIWEIEIDGGKYRTHSGQVDGKIVTKNWAEAEGKNVGKANETTPQQQALLEAQSKWDKKKKEGYHEDVNKIDSFIFFQPMLAKQFDDYKDKIKYPVFVDRKYNGIRCVRDIRGAFSRKGEPFFCINHILKVTNDLFKKWPNLVLDGELYNESYSSLLNRIASLVSVNRKEKDVTDKDHQESERIVKYYVYDAFNFAGVKQETRLSLRRDAIEGLLSGLPHIEIVKARVAHSEKDVYALMNEFVRDGYEGAIIRLDAAYETKRSKNLLKLKKFYDDEFKVVGIEEGTADWRGAAKRIICQIQKGPHAGKTFASNIDGTYEELKELFDNKQKHIGKSATVRYQELSEYGIPLIPYCSLPFRNFE
jgi:DNA ligase 1